MMYVLIISVKEKDIDQVKPCCDQRYIFIEFKTDNTTKTWEQEKIYNVIRLFLIRDIKKLTMILSLVSAALTSTSTKAEELRTDLEKAASGVCRHFVGNPTILRTF